jgi:hypothetical protein
MMIQQTRLTILIALSVLSAACAMAPYKAVKWPGNLPPMDYYENMYDRDRVNQKLQSRKSYLKWVVRFYEGWDLYQDGWHNTTRDILLGIENPSVRRRVKSKLARLGKLMSAEWAKEKPGRVIQSRELSIWGQALLKAVNNNQEEEFVDRVARDVNALLAGEMDRTDIALSRYFDSTAGGPDADEL